MGRLHSGRERRSRHGDADLPSVLDEFRTAFRVPADDLTRRRHLAAMYRAARREQRIRRSRRLLAASAAAVVVTASTGGLAAAGMLPTPVGRLLDVVLSPVGVDVPGISEPDRVVGGDPQNHRDTGGEPGSADLPSADVDRRGGRPDEKTDGAGGSARVDGGASRNTDRAGSKSSGAKSPSAADPTSNGRRDESPAQTAPGHTVAPSGSRQGDRPPRPTDPIDQKARTGSTLTGESRGGGKASSTTTTTSNVAPESGDKQRADTRQGSETGGSGGAPRS
ncbi:MAG: hypothetical protein KatS3mg008_0951 [Acidimicrobiales bacterium]|nr:MAG: hypothetical protein KatS3mg008_0951 [Acidimicrobiales bacterium]